MQQVKQEFFSLVEGTQLFREQANKTNMQTTKCKPTKHYNLESKHRYCLSYFQEALLNLLFWGREEPCTLGSTLYSNSLHSKIKAWRSKPFCYYPSAAQQTFSGASFLLQFTLCKPLGTVLVECISLGQLNELKRQLVLLQLRGLTLFASQLITVPEKFFSMV